MRNTIDTKVEVTLVVGVLVEDTQVVVVDTLVVVVDTLVVVVTPAAMTAAVSVAAAVRITMVIA